MRYLESKDVNKIGGVLFVAPWLDLLPEAVSDEESYNTAQPWLNTPINFEKIKQITTNINCLFSSDDYFVSLEQEKEFKDKLNANTCVVKNKGHISQDDDVFELQEILDLSMNMLNNENKEEIYIKNIIITGAANGVGKAVAYILNEHNLILVDEDNNNLEQVAKELNAKFYVCDLSNDSDIKTLLNDIENDYNNIDCLINCAGMWISGDMSKLEQPIFNEMNSLERIKKVIDTNVFGTIAMIKSIFPIMKKQGYGQIININSQSGVMCEPPFPIYNATKQSTNAFRKAIQDDLARNNIKITDVCPGLIQTDFYIRANNELPKEIMENGLTPEDVAKTVKYVFELPHEITIPSIEVRHIKNY